MNIAMSLLTALVVLWIVAHMLYLGPVLDATEATVAWGVTILVAGGLIAALALLTVGLLIGRTSPAWLRFVRTARTTGAVFGSAVIVAGLLHYRDTEPQGEITWVVVGLAVLAAAGLVHFWVVRAQRAALQ